MIRISVLFFIVFLPLALQAMMLPPGEGKIQNQQLRESTVKFGLVSQKEGELSSCTGSFISERTILTAAHCVPSESNPENLFIHFKINHEQNLSEDIDKIEGTQFKTIRFPGFSMMDSRGLAVVNDLALIVFEKSYHQGPLAQLLPEGEFIQNNPNQASYYVLGAGGRNFNRLVVDRELKDFTFGLIGGVLGTSASFQSLSNGILKLKTRQNAKVCEGDSGGPAIAMIGDQIYQVGVLSVIQRNILKFVSSPTTKCSRSVRIPFLTESKMNWIRENAR